MRRDSPLAFFPFARYYDPLWIFWEGVLPATRPFGVNTYSYTLGHSAADCLTRLADQGTTSVELMMYPGHAWPCEMDAVARRSLAALVASHSLQIRTLNMPNIDVNLTAANDGMRTLSVAHLVRVIALAGDLGVPGVVIGPGKPNPLLPAPQDQLIGWFQAALDVLLPAAEAAGTRLLAENMPFAFLPDAKRLMEAITPYREVGVVYDVANAVFIGEDLREGLRHVQDRLELVHLSDTPREVYRHDPVGGGAVDFTAFAEGLVEIGYAGEAMLEIISPEPDREISDSITRLLAMPAWQEWLA